MLFLEIKKTQVNHNILTVLIIMFCASSGFCQEKFKDFDKRKVIVKTDDDIVEAEVYDGVDEPKIKNNKTYYWFDHNMIMSSMGGYTGELLHGLFESQYRNYQLKEKGVFKYGLKHGVWRSWYENGSLKHVFSYKKGNLLGKYFEYDVSGRVIDKGRYNSKGIRLSEIDHKGQENNHGADSVKTKKLNGDKK